MGRVCTFVFSGFDESGKNMYAVEVDEAIFITGAGLKYPKSSQLGVELTVPDSSYLVQNKDRIKGIFIIYVHDNVIAALSYLLKQTSVPVYTENLTANITRDTLKKEDIKNVKIHRTKRASRQTVSGAKMRTSPMTYALPDNFGLAITTDQGYIAYTGEFIINYDMLQREYLCDLNELNDIGKRGMLCLFSESQSADCIGHTTPKYRITNLTESILEVSRSRILISSYPRGPFRIIEIIELAKKYNRKVLLHDRRARELLYQLELVKYYHVPREMEVKKKDFKDDMEDVVVLIMGDGRNLFRTTSNIVSHGNEFVNFRKMDTVIVASPIVSGTGLDANSMENKIYKEGGRIFMLDSKTVLSMHPGNEGLEMMLCLLQSKYHILVKGEYRHLFVNANLVGETGYSLSRILILENGQVAQFEEKILESAAEHLELEDTSIDDKEDQDVTGMVLKDRGVLSTDGVVITSAGVGCKTKEVTSGSDVQTRDLICPKDADYIIKGAGSIMERCIETAVKEERYDNLTMRGEAREKISEYLSKKAGKRLMVLLVILEINIQNDKRRGQEAFMARPKTGKS